MSWGGEAQKEVIRPEFNRSIMMDSQGAKITSDVGFLLLREIDEHFGILGPIGNDLEHSGSPLHAKYSLRQMVRRKVYQIAAGYEDCSDADFLRIDPALRLAIGKNTVRRDKRSRHRFAADQARLLVGILTYNFLHLMRGFYLKGEAAKRSIEWLIRRLIKVGARVSCHARRRLVRVASTSRPSLSGRIWVKAHAQDCG